MGCGHRDAYRSHLPAHRELRTVVGARARHVDAFAVRMRKGDDAVADKREAPRLFEG